MSAAPKRGKILRLEGTPNEKQKGFFLSRAKHTAYGGARGGGKSWAMRRKFVLLALRYENMNLLLLRRTLPELRENHEIPLLRELTGFVKYAKTDHTFTFPNGSRIVLGYCDAEDDVYRYQGQEYDVIGLEEATHFSEAQMQILTTCNRNVRTDFSPRMYYTCNPGNIGHAWVKRLFVDREYKGGESAGDYAFVQAKVYDNPVLMENDPTYVRTLEALPEAMRRAQLDGDWDVFAGQYFREFSRERHVIEPFKIPDDWRRFRSLDGGSNDPCCVLWHAVAPDGRIITYREIYVREMLARDVAKHVLALSAGEKISYTAASPDAWQTRGQSDLEGQSIADTFSMNGMSIIKADNTRVAGWTQVRNYLAIAPDKRPRWQCFSTCRNLIKTLPLLIYDEHNVEDVSGKCEDHAPEALRYALMSRPLPNKTAAPPKEHAFNPLEKPKPSGGGFYGV